MKNKSEILLYQTESGQTKLEVCLENETVWLTQKQMSELFQKSKATISEHIKNIYEEGELHEISTVRKFRTVQKEGKRQVEREIDFYNLDVIISVGYRVKSHRGTQFRIWATGRLKEFIILRKIFEACFTIAIRLRKESTLKRTISQMFIFKHTQLKLGAKLIRTAPCFSMVY